MLCPVNVQWTFVSKVTIFLTQKLVLLAFESVEKNLVQ